jgi:excisionase family DNA binding protein
MGSVDRRAVGAPSVLTAHDLARVMRVHPFTVARLARQQKIPGAFRFGGMWRFTTSDLLRWMENGGDAITHGNIGKRKRRKAK